jgi:hypothetical protein
MVSPELRVTEIGKAFSLMRNRFDTAWSYDGSIGQNDYGPSSRQLDRAKELWKQAEAAQDVFIELLEKLVLERT